MQWWPGSIRNVSIAEKIRALVGAPLDTIVDDAKDRDALRRFYEGRNHAPVWVRSGGPTEQFRAAVARLKAADADGLDASDYPAPASGDQARGQQCMLCQQAAALGQNRLGHLHATNDENNALSQGAHQVFEGAHSMPPHLSDTASANGLNNTNDLPQHQSEQNFRERKQPRNRNAAALAEVQQRAAMAEQRLDDLRALLAEVQAERDAWREQAQRLVLREWPAKRPSWWLWGS
jgi:Scaffold domain